MKFYQTWRGYRIENGRVSEPFEARVPGNIQYDYGVSQGFSDVMYADGCRQYEALENDIWEYRTTLSYEKRPNERVWFVSHGIDYRYDVKLNGETIYSYEGVFRPFELDLTDKLLGNDELCVVIHPHPKRKGSVVGTRDEAAASCKPPVCYGWDWNPRLLISGMWQEAYVEIRTEEFVRACEVSYTLASDYSEARVHLEIDCAAACEITLTDAEGTVVYQGTAPDFSVTSPRLWWCRGQGEPYLYTWTVKSASHERSGTVGFRTVKLVRNEGAYEAKMRGYPKSRWPAPFTLMLNGRRVFMKGTNLVNHEIFWGHMNESKYQRLVELAIGANMNIVRLWGGASVFKQCFYDICDREGLLVWQEFMLACNAYPDDDRYLAVLESEATAMIQSLRSHACLAFWCGGNELFNNWSGMDDQSLPLRMLNKLCYELDRERAFLMTSPLEGMAHGGYMFHHEKDMGGDVFECFGATRHIAYTEFGVPSFSDMETLKRIIPEEELKTIAPTDSWVLHHAFKAWRPEAHAWLDTHRMYFGETKDVARVVENSNWLQSEGLKGCFEEFRRQAPYCSAALNWAFNEPWYTAANLNVIRYPDVPKPAYYAVKEALRDVMFSARIPKFSWLAGEKFKAEIWLLNDSPEAVSGSVEVLIEIGGETVSLLSWEDASAEAGKNFEGAQVCFALPNVERIDRFRLILKAENGMESSYELHYHRPAPRPAVRLNT